MGFTQFGFSSELLEGLDAMNFKDPTPVQQQAIPAILEGKDILASAQTGTGKTAAFLLPIIERTHRTTPENIDTLIIVPTRELGQQIDQQLEGFGYYVPLSSMAIYGGGDGQGFEQQKKALMGGTEIVIATPGKLLSHLNMGYVNMKSLRHLVLDEVDRMLDMGFIDDIQKIMTYLPEKKQTLFFSATMPPRIKQLAMKLLKDPVQISISMSKPAEGIKQGAYLVYDTQKLQLLKSIFKNKDLKSAILFAGTKQKVKEVERELKKMGLNVGAIHSDLDQSQRDDVLLGFRNRNVTILVATDVVSRGIDVVGIELVVNYDVPADPEDYVHRIGRTARAETLGEAVTLINDHDQRKFQRIEKMIEKEIDKLPLPEGMEEGPVYAPEKKTFGRSGGSGKSGFTKAAAGKEKPAKRGSGGNAGSHSSVDAQNPTTKKPQNSKPRSGKPRSQKAAPEPGSPPVLIDHEKRKREYEERVKRREEKK